MIRRVAVSRGARIQKTLRLPWVFTHNNGDCKHPYWNNLTVLVYLLVNYLCKITTECIILVHNIKQFRYQVDSPYPHSLYLYTGPSPFLHIPVKTFPAFHRNNYLRVFFSTLSYWGPAKKARPDKAGSHPGLYHGSHSSRNEFCILPNLTSVTSHG